VLKKTALRYALFYIKSFGVWGDFLQKKQNKFVQSVVFQRIDSKVVSRAFERFFATLTRPHQTTQKNRSGAVLVGLNTFVQRLESHKKVGTVFDCMDRAFCD
jgi:hypothetical protein